ncbi:hypothetical protein [Pseudomonas sp. FME51]|uniref:hypothetical protein n=1 Tax=Pseudomonas sp. FME51 TaxID=2742609 RepID=UPI001865FBF8|nr:hypothetical protein [Pseudomonas sp. FME51]
MARQKQFLIVLGSCVGMALILGLINRLVHHQSLDLWVMIGVLCTVGFVLTFFLSWGMALVLAVGMPLLVTIGMSLLAKPGAEQGLEGILFIVLSMFFMPSVAGGLAIRLVVRRI